MARGAPRTAPAAPRPRNPPWKAAEGERAIVCALRRSTDFPLDDLTFVVSHFLPHLNRDGVWRTLKAEGLNRRPKPVADTPAKGQAVEQHVKGMTFNNMTFMLPCCRG